MANSDRKLAAGGYHNRGRREPALSQLYARRGARSAADAKIRSRLTAKEKIRGLKKGRPVREETGGKNRKVNGDLTINKYVRAFREQGGRVRGALGWRISANSEL